MDTDIDREPEAASAQREGVPLITFVLVGLAWVLESLRLAALELDASVPVPLDILLSALAVGLATYGMLEIIFPLRPGGWVPGRGGSAMIAATVSLISSTVLVVRLLSGLPPRPGGRVEVVRLVVIVLMVVIPVVLGVRERELERLILWRATAISFLVVGLTSFAYFLLERYAGFPTVSMLWPAVLAGVSWIGALGLVRKGSLDRRSIAYVDPSFGFGSR